MAFIAFWFFSFFLVVSAIMVVVARNPVHAVLYLIVSIFNAAALFLLLGAEFLAMLLIIVYVGAVAVLFLFVVMMLDIKENLYKTIFSFPWSLQNLLALRDLIIYSVPFAVIFAGGGLLLQHFGFLNGPLKTVQAQLVIAGVLFFLARFMASFVTRINCFETVRRLLKGVPLPFLLGLVIIGELCILASSYQISTPLSSPPTLAGEEGVEKILNTTLLGRILYTQYILPFFLSGFILLVAMIGAINLTLRTRDDSKRQRIRTQLARNKSNSIDMVDVPLGQGLGLEKDKA